MNFIQAIILGIVEGLTEFLPISSTGHLILTADLMKIEPSNFLTSFEISVQLAAILAVVFLYWRVLLNNRALVGKVLLAFIPTAIIGLLAYDYLKEYLLLSRTVVLFSLLIGGVVIVVFEFFYKDPINSQTDFSALTYKKSVLIGLFQAIAIVPGVSRAAATILGGLTLGLNRRTIVEFSFLLAVPTMAAATALDLYQNLEHFKSGELGVLAVGFVTAFVTAVIGIRFFLKYINTHSFSAFGVYRILLALAFWLFAV